MRKLFILLVVLLLPMGAIAYDFESNGMYYNILSASDRTVSLTYKDENFNSYSGDIVIPSIVKYKEIDFVVENVDYYTFRECKNLKSITLPQGLKGFGTNNVVEGSYISGFNGCGVWDLYVPDVETWLNLDTRWDATPLNPNGSLYVNGELLVDLIIPEGTRFIRYGCFSGCRSLKTVRFSSTVEGVYVFAFQSCPNLEKVVLNEGLQYLTERVFAYCPKLREINLPSSLRSLANCNGFLCGCESLEDPLIVPEGIETIPASAFSGCKKLKEISLPSTLKEICMEAFNGCESLQRITSKSKTPPTCTEYDNNSTIFNGVDKFSCAIYVPKGTKSLYSSATGWKLFFNIMDELTSDDSNNKNNDISVTISSYGSSWSNGYSEYASFSVFNESSDLLLLTSVRMYNYYNSSEVYYSNSTVNSYISANSSYGFTYDNNSGTKVLFEKAWIIELNYLNMTKGGSLITKKVYKPENSMSNNIPLADISDDVTGITPPILRTNKKSREYFDLQGRKVKNPKNGPYIIDGKKVVIK